MLTSTTDNYKEISFGLNLDTFLTGLNNRENLKKQTRRLHGKNKRRVVGGLGFRQTAPPTFKIKGRLQAMARRICRAMYDVTKVRVQLGRFADPLSKLAIEGRIKCTQKFMIYEQNLELASQN